MHEQYFNGLRNEEKIKLERYLACNCPLQIYRKLNEVIKFGSYYNWNCSLQNQQIQTN